MGYEEEIKDGWRRVRRWGITRRADDSRQRAIEAGVDGGARTALVISASQC